MFWFRIVSATLIPGLTALLFYYLDEKTGFGKLSALRRQLIIGAAFGVLACLATQFGIPDEGYVLNIRSAAPLTAGLVFGGPAGLIAGVLGALYRWFGVYWGVPAYTRVACSVATLLAGVIAAVCRKYMFDNKTPSWFYGMFVAIATEVFHMLLVFITHMDDIARAFEVVRKTAVTMIVANSISVLLSLIFVTLISGEGFRKKKYTRPITQTFAVYLFASVLIAFIATSGFTYFLQKNVADLQVEELLSKNVSDTEADVSDALDREIGDKTKTAAAAIGAHSFFTDGENKDGLRQKLQLLLTELNASAISVADRDGKIAVSTEPALEGSDIGDDRGIALDGGYTVRVSVSTEYLRESARNLLAQAATNRHIGQTGFIFVLDPIGEKTVISAPADTVDDESVRDFLPKIVSLEDGAVLNYETPEGVKYDFMKDTLDGYIVIGCIPETEAFFARDAAVYIGAFMQLVVFFVLFLLVFFLLKNIIVNNIHKVNRSLSQITEGNLDTRVDVRANEEFTSLSDDINTTVSRLKDYIDEAEKRIDRELALAKSIQHSALPSVFPPFPNRHEFDLFASMDTAKEVGGDFYDFYLLGRNHLVFLIADVSGKGIPAAMFMMTAKTMIKSFAESGLGVAEVLTRTNEKLCESNEAGMFVTAWMGVLNLKTGAVKFANAGHNPPAVRRADGTFEYLRSRPGLVLAGMDGVTYRENETELRPGDQLFLYTDGVTEATDADSRLFGEDRLLATLNENASRDAEGICRAVSASLDAFVGDAPQFDDITMLSLKFRQYADEEEK